jgi:hypothetical protein
MQTNSAKELLEKAEKSYYLKAIQVNQPLDAYNYAFTFVNEYLKNQIYQEQ